MTKTQTKAIVLFARDPVAGQVKTRLSSSLSQELILELYTRFLSDSIQKICKVSDADRFWDLVVISNQAAIDFIGDIRTEATASGVGTGAAAVARRHGAVLEDGLLSVLDDLYWATHQALLDEQGLVIDLTEVAATGVGAGIPVEVRPKVGSGDGGPQTFDQRRATDQPA